MTYDLSKAFLADKVYDENLAKGQTFTDTNGATWSVVANKSDAATDYQGALFKNETTGQYVFASRGTESVKDGLNDLQMGIGFLPSQMAIQHDFFEKVKAAVLIDGGNPTSIDLVGHSLGGALIQALAVENPQNKADTFNTYGVGNLIEVDEGKTYSNITNHLSWKDPVSVAYGSKMIGTTLAYGPMQGTSDEGGVALINHPILAYLPFEMRWVLNVKWAAEDAVNEHRIANFLKPEFFNDPGTVVTLPTLSDELASSLNSVLDALTSLFSPSSFNMSGGNEALISELQKQFNAAQVIISPLVLDLDGDGLVETTQLSKSLTSGTHFNLDAKGLSENTGWVGQDDGLLVRDLDGDGKITSGRELFGNHSLLANGQEAANGFEALQDLDSNADGVINAQDQAFASLQVWKDANGDGVTDAGELLSLTQADVASLNVSYSAATTTDAQGNQHLQLGGYTTTTGSTRRMNDVWFATDSARTQDHEDSLAVTAEIAALPNVAGMGNVRSLQQAMVRDTTGALQALVQQWKTGTMEQRESVLDSLIYHWTGVQDVDPNSRGDFIGDARRLAVLEEMLGQTYVQSGGNIYGSDSSNPGNVAADGLNAMYKQVRTTISDQLFIGSDGQELLEQLRLRWVEADPNAVEGSVEASAHFSWDTSAVATTLNEQFSQKNVQEGVGTVVDFFRALNTFQQTDILQSLKAQATNYSGTYAMLLQQADVFASNMGVGLGTDDQLRAASAGGVLFGLAGNDVLESGDGQDILVGGSGNDILFAGYGSDILDGGDGDDILDGGYSDADTVRGGSGNDTIEAGGDIEGGTGNDTIYLRVTSAKNIVHFNVGDGQDTLHTGGAGAGRQDTLSLGPGINPSDIQLMRSGNDFVFKFNANDQVTVADWFLHYSYRIDQIQFADGTAWTIEDLYSKPIAVFQATEQADTVQGWEGVDNILGLDGDDLLFGNAGNDILDGGAGNDVLLGGTGNDVYVFGRGSGADTVIENDGTPDNVDQIDFLSDVQADQLWFRQEGYDLEVSIIGTSDKLTVQNWYSGAANQVEQFKTADNKTLLNSQVENLVSAMAAFAPPASGQTTLPANYQTSLNPVIAANWT